jgi:hypothetical protein
LIVWALAREILWMSFEKSTIGELANDEKRTSDTNITNNESETDDKDSNFNESNFGGERTLCTTGNDFTTWKMKSGHRLLGKRLIGFTFGHIQNRSEFLDRRKGVLERN